MTNCVPSNSPEKCGEPTAMNPPPARLGVWLGAACAVIAVLLLFHNTGWEQLGFNRFSLDYIPVLLALGAPRAVTGRWRWLSAVMIAWSVYYFRFLI